MQRFFPDPNGAAEYRAAKRQRLAEASQECLFPSSWEGQDWNTGSHNELVCFGMVTGISGRCERRGTTLSEFTVNFDASDRFSTSDGSGIRGVVSSTHHCQMIQGLLEEKTLTLFVTCRYDVDSTTACKPVQDNQCSLDISVYGLFDLFESIGPWLQEYDAYLQDPRTCHLDVKYCNPHRISSEHLEVNPLLSEVVSRTSAHVHLENVKDRPDLLDVLNCQNDLEETAQPMFIQSNLQRHQKQALTFMLRREKGWNFNDEGADVWEVLDTSHVRVYINRISDMHQADEPPSFSGGIIADPMGLGKTLTMLSLIATDLEFPPFTNGPRKWEIDQDANPPVQATLVIVPQPLLGTWEAELAQHQWEGSMSACRHHGKSRLDSIDQIGGFNMVITTYHTLSADWKAWKAGGSNIIFSVRWKRIILDEAHVIRNMKSRLARSVCELDSISRWAVTGTPIQNHIGDLAALLRFIRASPYDEPKRFEADISQLWKAGEDEEAVKRLQRLARYLILRRGKRTIDLPNRRDKYCPVYFTKAERDVYDDIKKSALMKIDDALLHESDLTASGVYVNFLQQIESMRLVCNLGLHYHTRHDVKTRDTQEVFDWVNIAQQAFNIQRSMGIISCLQCTSVLDPENIFSEDTILDDPSFSRCLRYTCPECTYKTRLAGRQKLPCGHTPRCPSAPISLSQSSSEEFFTQSLLPPKSTPVDLPSKVRVLIADLQGLPSDVKSIVFSTWRLTLDLVERGLGSTGIQSVRFDGKVPQTQRQTVLNQFKTNPNVRVMLLTLSCGAVGLTLTEASRAYLMEPHWNPTIEEQALARIHRIGQMREVTTVRFYIRDSFEERVMEVQESKKNLAGVLLSGHDGGQADDSLGALQRLRLLL